jgi:hypothetical protein
MSRPRSTKSDSANKGGATFDLATDLALRGAAYDPNGYRAELVELVAAARELDEG